LGAALMRWLWAGTWALATLGFCPHAAASSEDPWWGHDKALHFAASASLAAGGYALASLAVDAPAHRAALGGAFALSIGLAKELHDAQSGGQASYRDLTWNALGTAVGLGIAVAVDQFMVKPRTHGSQARDPRPLFAVRW
jgi:uncharacterized protein YfiM (DUF2279 family)